MTDNSERSQTPPTSKKHTLGPAPLPTFHGNGCICNQYPRKDCPALQTPEGQQREKARELNGARWRLREAEIRWREAGGEIERLRAVLNRMASGNVPATDFVQLASDALVGSPDETKERPVAHIQLLPDGRVSTEIYRLPPGEHDVYRGPQMAMLPNEHHPGPRCSCRECLREFPEE